MIKRVNRFIHLITNCTVIAFFCSTTSISKAQSPYVDVKEGISKPLPADYLGQNAANIIQIRSLTDGSLRSKIPQLHPGTIRHVASSQSNWWDWKTGWLLKQEDLLPGYTIRDDWAVLDPLPDKISDLKYLVDTTGSSVIFAPNLLTSRLDYQVAALFEFANQNILAPYVEMGSEFYLDNTAANQRFPTCLDYADTASKWIAGFKTLFPNIKISCIGATEQGNSARRNTWTQTVIDEAEGYDALSVKVFLPTGLNLPDTIIPKSALPKFFSKPFKAMEPSGEVGIELAKLGEEGEMWISEYNLTDQRYAINGHWAHGLFEAALTLTFLSDSRITRISQFRMSGDALHGNLFETDQGFNNGPAFISLDPTLPTKANEFTATGNAMRLIGSSLQLATSVSPLIFTPQNGAVISELNGGYLSLVGYKIEKPISEEMIVLNLSNDSTLLHVQEIMDSAIVYYEVLWWPSDTARRPLVEITGDIPIMTGTISNGQIYAPPYSILRIYQKKMEVYAIATDDTICEGTSTTILAYGAKQYSWSPDVNTSGNQSIVYVTPLTTTTYTVTGTEECIGLNCTKSVTIHVVPKPLQGIISVVPSTNVCPETPVTLSVQQTNANKFCWSGPDVGLQFAQPTITIKPKDTTTYYLFGANNGCYSYRDSVTIFIRPSANASTDHLDCIGDSLLIGTPAVDGLTYSWAPVNGLSNAAIAQPLAAPLTTATFTLTVTDPFAGCSDTDSVKVEPVQCCVGDANVPVFPPNSTASYFLNSMLNDFGADVNLNNGVLNGYTGEILINGAFIIDTDLSIINCPKIILGEKAVIYVTAPNVKFKLKGDSLQTCGLFNWSGIRSTNILSNVIIDSTFIANADTVLLSKNDADYAVKNSYFHNFICGIFMLNYLEELENEVPEGEIYGTVFEGNNNSSTGIVSEHVNMLNIGNTAKSPNIFRDMYAGINIQNGNAVIVNNTFQELLNGILLADTFSNPLLAPEYDITIGGDDVDQKNTFEKTPTAIHSDYMNLYVKGNTIANCDYGIWAVKSISRVIEVSKNTMTGVFKGVNLTGNRSTNYVIKNNTIVTKEISGNLYPIGIQLTDLSPSSGISGSARITANEIDSKGLYGILISNNNGIGYDPDINVTPQISNNIIKLQYTGTQSFAIAGIRMENCINNAIGYNTIEGISNSGSRLQGISLFGVSGIDLFCNSFKEVTSGIIFIGNNNNDSTWHNKFTDADTCLQVGQSIVLYGKLNDQSGNTNFTSGNEFQNSDNLHLVKLDLPAISYYTGNNETYAPTNTLNFDIFNSDLPAFSCMQSTNADTGVQSLPDSCADTTATHAALQAIIQEYPVNDTSLINDNETFLWGLANSCPVECGTDIFIARGLLCTKYDNLIFNDDSLCSIPTMVNELISLNEALTLYPNPASDLITIKCFTTDESPFQLVITDISGQQIATYQLTGKINYIEVNTNNYQSGCYLVNLYSRNTRSKVVKFMILR